MLCSIGSPPLDIAIHITVKKIPLAAMIKSRGSLRGIKDLIKKETFLRLIELSFKQKGML